MVTLAQVPLFAALDAAAFDEVVGRSATQSFAKGDTLWCAGDAADHMLVLLSGQLEVWGGVAGGDGQLLGRLGPGECVGELGLLVGERRTATVTCARTAEALRVSRSDFAELITTNQAALGVLLATVSDRARAMASGAAPPSGARIVVVTATKNARGANLVAAALADCTVACGAGNALLVTFDADAPVLADVVVADLRKRRGRSASLVVAPERVADGMDALSRLAETRFRVVVVALPQAHRGQLQLLAERCDAVIELGTPNDEPLVAPGAITVTNLWPTYRPQPQLEAARAFVLPVEPALRGLELDAAVKLLITRPALPIARVLFRLTRTLLGASVGLALGAGAAFGIAHVGVLAALEEAGVPVDVVAGSSFGAIIGAGLAGGLSPGEMTEIARRIGNVRTALSALDPSLSGAGLLAGKRLVAIFSPFISQERFEDLVMPMAAVTTDISTGERVALTSGAILPAMRASCAIPLVFTPSSINGRVLVDGGLVDPVPVDVARELGADIVVGVNVVPQLRRSGPSSLGRVFRQVNRFNPLAMLSGTRDLPDLVDVMMSTMQTVYHELGNVGTLAADVAVNVDSSGFSWIDFHRAMDLIERGRAAGEVAAQTVKSLVEDRLRGA